MANLFATKPLNLLMEEARETGENSLKRTLGVFQLTALGVGAIIGAGIFVMVGLGAHYAGPGLTLSFVLSGLGCAFAGLCYAEFAAMIPLAGSAYTYAYATLGELIAWIIGWDLTLEYAMGASTVSSGWSNHFIELLNIFHVKMPLWLAYDHWTAVKTAENIVARQMAQTADSSLVPGTQAFLDKVSALIGAQSPELLQRAHELMGAPHLFGVEIGFNLPAFLIALVITAILVVGIKESARFNTGIVVIKVAVVLFVIALGAPLHQPRKLGYGLAHIRAARLRGNWGGRSLHILCLHWFRCGVDHGAGGEESAARLADWHDRFVGGVYGLVHCRGWRADGNGALAADQHRSPSRRCIPGPGPNHGGEHHYSGSFGWADQRDAGNVTRPNASALFHGQRRPFAEEILRGGPS
jgi:hypothetical protein